MKAAVRTKWLRGQRGNTVVLMTVICTLLTLLSLVSLDVFSVLISRRFAQTDADAAATASVHAVEPVVLGALLEDANAKATRLVDEAWNAWQPAYDSWQTARSLAEEASMIAHTDKDGNVDRVAVASDIAHWRADHPEPQRSSYIVSYLAREIRDQAIIAYMVGQNEEMPEPQQYITALLSEHERGCSVERVQATAQERGLTRARLFLRNPEVSSLEFTFPYKDHAWVAVTVKRQIPTVFIRRLAHKDPADPVNVTTGAAATLRGFDQITISACH